MPKVIQWYTYSYHKYGIIIIYTEHNTIWYTTVQYNMWPLQINFLFPVHRPHLFPANNKSSIISVIFHYLCFFSYTHMYKMTLVNVTVYCNSTSSHTVRWTIYDLQDLYKKGTQPIKLIMESWMEMDRPPAYYFTWVAGNLFGVAYTCSYITS